MRLKAEDCESWKLSKNYTPWLFTFLLVGINSKHILDFDFTQSVAALGTLAMLSYLQLIPDRISKLTTVVTLIGISLLSFFIPFSNLQRWLILLLISSLSLFYKNRKYSKEKLNGILNVSMRNYLLVFTAYRVTLHFKSYVLQFMTYGYDNAFHFSLYKAYRVTSWFPFLNPSEWGSNFSLFRTYPSGQAALFSFITGIFLGDNLATVPSICAYFLILIFTFIGLASLTKSFILPNTEGPLNAIAWAAAVVVTTAFAGVLVVNGFPPYLFGFLLVLIWTSTLRLDQPGKKQIYLLGITTLSLQLISPLIVLCIVFPASIIIIREIRFFWALRRIQLAIGEIVYIVAGAILAFYFTSMTSSRFGWRQVLSGGGIQVPNIFEAIGILSISAVVLYLERKKILKNGLLLVALSTLASFALLALLTIHYTGTIQYYAIKQFYLCLTLLSAVVIHFLISIKRTLIKSFFNTFFVAGVFLFCFFFSASFHKGFMGTLPNAIRADSQISNWHADSVDAEYLIKVLGDPTLESENSCIVFRLPAFDSDLNSRWANAISSKTSTSEECFGMYWNSNLLSDAELLSKLKQGSSHYILVVSQIQKDRFAKNLPINTILFPI